MSTFVGASSSSPARVARTLRPATLSCVSLVIALFLTCTVFALPAFADNTKVTSEVQVSDDIARVHVAKLDSDTHGYVTGATMAIIDKETGEVVDEWVTTSARHEKEKGQLVVDRVYILRELSAPEGYSKAADTEFIINATEGTGVTILSGADAELTESYVINLYDKPGVTEKEVVVTKESPGSSKTVAPKTGDETPLTAGAGIVLGGLVLIVLLQFAKSRIPEE